MSMFLSDTYRIDEISGSPVHTSYQLSNHEYEHYVTCLIDYVQNRVFFTENGGQEMFYKVLQYNPGALTLKGFLAENNAGEVIKVTIDAKKQHGVYYKTERKCGGYGTFKIEDYNKPKCDEELL